MRHWTLAVLAAVLTTSCTDRQPLEAPSAPSFAADGGTVSALNTPPTGNFRYTPATRAGQAPLAFEVNMCKSVDPDATDDLRFVVSWGDGTSDRGLCYLRHTYEKPGRYDGRACVSDRVLGSPESCEDFVVDVVSKEAPLELVTVRTSPSPLAQGVPVTGVATPSGPFNEGPIAGADLASARRIVVEFGPVISNPMSDFRVGLQEGTTLFLAGSPNLGGLTGSFTVELTPGQFAGVGSVSRFVLSLTGTGMVQFQSGWTYKVSVYR